MTDPGGPSSHSCGPWTCCCTGPSRARLGLGPGKRKFRALPSPGHGPTGAFWGRCGQVPAGALLDLGTPQPRPLGCWNASSPAPGPRHASSPAPWASAPPRPFRSAPEANAPPCSCMHVAPTAVVGRHVAPLTLHPLSGDPAHRFFWVQALADPSQKPLGPHPCSPAVPHNLLSWAGTEWFEPKPDCFCSVVAELGVSGWVRGHQRLGWRHTVWPCWVRCSVDGWGTTWSGPPPQYLQHCGWEGGSPHCHARAWPSYQQDNPKGLRGGLGDRKSPPLLTAPPREGQLPLP